MINNFAIFLTCIGVLVVALRAVLMDRSERELPLSRKNLAGERSWRDRS